MRTFITLAFLLFPVFFFGQKTTGRQDPDLSENHANPETLVKKRQFVRVVFYNLENLYDPFDDTTKLDEEFTPKGIKRWTFGRFLQKLNHLAKTFMAIGEWEPPAIIGMCEVENRYVLNKMIYETPLKKYKYRFIHFESEDARGIDVAILYRPDLFRIEYSRSIRIQFPFDSLIHTRDILYVKGILFTGDTLHLFVNHWPSRRGGFAESVPKRKIAAQKLRSVLDTLQQNQADPQIIIMGDFNDEPDQPAIARVLGAAGLSDQTRASGLVNLMLPLNHNPNEGTHKFQGKWAILDQFMVTGNFFLKRKSLQTSREAVHIFHAAFLMEDDERFMGGRPVRTYAGPRYTGGFSDHLPIYLDIWKNREAEGP
ncbi:MAG: endonuclease [Bacteroidetes bacterium]|nr:endonuclease [Bacteroidota bacterium]